eukprot:1138244-Rhodomonas_salina.1
MLLASYARALQKPVLTYQMLLPGFRARRRGEGGHAGTESYPPTPISVYPPISVYSTARLVLIWRSVLTTYAPAAACSVLTSSMVLPGAKTGFS